jgi:hypothetical protein
LTIFEEQSSQWDGLRHFSQAVPSTDQKTAERTFYGGTTAAEILNPKNDRIGMQHWAREGIAGTQRLKSFFNTHMFKTNELTYLL